MVTAMREPSTLPADADFALLVGWLREGVQVEDLADSLGVSRETVWYWQKTGRPPSRMARRSICRVVNAKARAAVKEGQEIPVAVRAELERLGILRA